MNDVKTIAAAIGSARYLDVLPCTRPVERGEKHQVGQSYWSAYWQYVYVVEAIDGCSVTVRTPQNGRVWTHFTALDRRDRIFI